MVKKVKEGLGFEKCSANILLIYVSIIWIISHPLKRLTFVDTSTLQKVTVLESPTSFLRVYVWILTARTYASSAGRLIEGGPLWWLFDDFC